MGDETELFMRGGNERGLYCRWTFRRDEARELARRRQEWDAKDEKRGDENFPFFESCFGAGGRVQR
jgi:hypothetical protein